MARGLWGKKTSFQILLVGFFDITIGIPKLLLHLRSILSLFRLRFFNDTRVYGTHGLALSILIKYDVTFILNELTLRKRAVESVKRWLRKRIAIFESEQN